MFLKRIELYGFKSFADRTEFQFVPGITAVVGPNGSGKSNVSDAIRWVLGEQSAKSLRGSKMEDIIFSGSDSRKAINFGEVVLTLDNLDRSVSLEYSEITITRKVFRSGESEFYINKQLCRLKDITELFMDTGLGKEAYSIIGQGRIEEILSTKPEDRRGMLEEAAGIVKYKSRKKETEKKLDETDANLARIRDIMYELEEQLNPLAEQAEKAKTYTQLKETLRKKEISVYAYKIEALHQKWETASVRLQRLKLDKEQHQFSLNQKELEAQTLQLSLDQLEEEHDRLQKELIRMTEEVEKAEGQKEVLRERLKNFSSNKQERMERLQLVQKQRNLIAEEVEQEREQVHGLQAQLHQLEKELEKETRHSFSRAEEIDEQIEDLKGEYIQLLNQKASLKNERLHLEQSQGQIEQRLLKMKQEEKQLVEESGLLQESLQQAKGELREISQQLDDSQKQQESLTKLDQKQQERAAQLEEKLRREQSHVEQLSSKKAWLQELKEDFSGFFQGVKEVLKARASRLTGIDGAVAELIQVPKELEIAIEIALGGAMQHIVVEDEEAGKQAIQFLKKRGLGRATFLPRTIIKPRSVSELERSRLDRSPGFVGVAHELISFDERYRSVLANLLGQVLITRDLETANQLAKQLHYRYRLVTLGGDVVHPGGSMTGGSVKKSSSNLLGRERELEQIKEKLRQQKEICRKDEDELAALNLAKAKQKEQLEELRHAIEKMREVEQTKKEQLTQRQYQLDRVTEKKELLTQDQEAYRIEWEELQRRVGKNDQGMQHVEQKVTQIEQDIKELESLRKESQLFREEKSHQVTQMKVKFAAKKQELEGSERRLKELLDRKKQLDQQWETDQQDLLLLEGNLGQQDLDQDDLEEQIKTMKEKRISLQHKSDDLRLKRREKQQEWSELSQQMKQLHTEEQRLDDEILQEEVMVNRLDVEIENDLSYLREEYEISFELAREQFPLEQEYEAAKEEVDQLGQQIDRLGPVNLHAIEDYQRLNERYSFLKKQEEDLLQATEKLVTMVREIDQEMSKRFRSTFEHVREQFHLVFGQLFGGGRADLILTDPEDLLETGIDIVAQPPGKKLQNLALLSGGERALTAIAILFAILKVKPVPFCVLDEVEAALDEANVSRFAQYLRQFAGQTQFIVITHRKGTMEEADVLYGVTMEESGVSKLVSVKLEENTDTKSA